MLELECRTRKNDWKLDTEMTLGVVYKIPLRLGAEYRTVFRNVINMDNVTGVFFYVEHENVFAICVFVF